MSEADPQETEMATITMPEPVAATAIGDDALYEVVQGRRVECARMAAYPGEVASILLEYLAPFARKNKLGKVVAEVLFLLDAEDELQRRPDVAFVSSARWPVRRRAPDDAAWDVVPDLAVEVVSPTDRAEDLLGKIREYFRCGVRLAWVIYPREQVIHVFESFTTIRALTRDDELDGGAVVPGFKLPLAELFAGEEEGETTQA